MKEKDHTILGGLTCGMSLAVGGFFAKAASELAQQPHITNVEPERLHISAGLATISLIYGTYCGLQHAKENPKDFAKGMAAPALAFALNVSDVKYEETEPFAEFDRAKRLEIHADPFPKVDTNVIVPPQPE